MRRFLIWGMGLLVLITGGALTYFYHERHPLVSVVMSTYQRPQLLVRAIESILNQTYPHFELIIINDSPDDLKTTAVLERYKRYDSRIKVIQNPSNQGLIYSLNAGLDRAKGKYIARMDDDDISYPNRLERQVAFMEAHPEITVTGSWVSPVGSDEPYPFQRETDPDIIKIDLYMGNAAISHPSAMIRRAFLEQHRIRYNYDFKSAEDRRFWMDIFEAGGIIGNMPEVLLHYRWHYENPQDYYVSQDVNVKKFKNEVFEDFLGPDFRSNDIACITYEKMVKANKEKNILNQSKFKQKVDATCPKGENIVYHKLWRDLFVFKENNRFCRARIPYECGSVRVKNTEKLTVKWDKWGEESFTKRSDGIWYLDSK